MFLYKEQTYPCIKNRYVPVKSDPLSPLYKDTVLYNTVRAGSVSEEWESVLSCFLTDIQYIPTALQIYRYTIHTYSYTDIQIYNIYLQLYRYTILTYSYTAIQINNTGRPKKNYHLTFCLICQKPKNIIKTVFFLLKTEIYMQILNTRTILCAPWGLNIC